MKKGIIKEEDIVKISITTKRERDELDDYILKILMAKKKRKQSN